MKSVVQPVKDPTDIALVKKLLTKHHGQMYTDVWEFGINTALRVSDILSIKYEDIRNDRIALKEKKTRKYKDIKLVPKLMDIVARRRTENPNHVYLFQSSSNRAKSMTRPLSKTSVYNSLSAVGEIVGVHMGTHSMRKTRGYHVYNQTKDIGLVMDMLNHSSERETLRYIGINQEVHDKLAEEIVL
ncbi:tyrosine-type recombinase/integrase [Photobacterium lutimaris]|uniref:Site-specific integrase n=1 Tax=Photobacterium lutimaris TaxID=388278 RepID=A0A2T3J4K5_9GAMM|nr:tyrosine-type recombinase/integrase [Photobacterium lutimaris]PSU36218.1 site-specific integrase [Photobacterium lutimaris]TDR74908.1 phage integrase family protein [Photobacterium lutimaris]